MIESTLQKELTLTNQAKECALCHYRYFLNTGYRYEPEACNGCHNISMMVYELKDFAILDIKRVDYQYFIWNINRNVAINWLNNSKFDVRVNYKSSPVRYGLWCVQNTN